MRIKSFLKVALGALFALALVCTVAVAWLKLAPRQAPVGQPPFETLRAESFSRFRDAFNAHEGEVRIVAMLSPT